MYVCVSGLGFGLPGPDVQGNHCKQLHYTYSGVVYSQAKTQVAMSPVDMIGCVKAHEL